MELHFCDLCGQPIKLNRFYTLYVSVPRNLNEEKSAFDISEDISRNAKEICEHCKYIFDKVFEYRLKNLYKITKDISFTYNLPTQLNLAERKNEKKKKKL